MTTQQLYRQSLSFVELCQLMSKIYPDTWLDIADMDMGDTLGVLDKFFATNFEANVPTDVAIEKWIELLRMKNIILFQKN